MTQAPTPGPLSVGDRVVAVADLRKHPDGPVWVKKGEEVGIVREYGVGNCIAGVALQDGREGDWAKSCFRLAPTAPVENPDEPCAPENAIDWPTAPVEASGSERDVQGLVRPDAMAGRRWRHKERGTTYTALGFGKAQCSPSGLLDDENVVIYQGDDGSLWARRHAEFTDGRFEEIQALRALSTTPARAEAQDEGAAGEVVAFDWRYLEFDGTKTEHLTRYDPRASTRHDKSWVKDVRALYAHPSPTPAADADRVREEVTRVEALIEDLTYAAMPTKPDVVTLCGSAASQARDDLRAILAALKSTAAKEGET